MTDESIHDRANRMLGKIPPDRMAAFLDAAGVSQNPRLIAFCSPAMGSGKSTAAQHLVEQHRFVRLAFATPLKAMASALLLNAGLPDEEVYDRVQGSRKEEIIPVLGISSRRLQQLLGTEFGRKMIHEDIWVNLTLANARSYLDRGISVVIDDMRFPNEYHAVIAAGSRGRMPW